LGEKKKEKNFQHFCPILSGKKKSPKIKQNSTLIFIMKGKLDEYTKIELTNVTSKIVGTTLKTKAARIKLMPRLPRSIAYKINK